MSMRRHLCFYLLGGFMALAQGAAAELQVFAAASLSDVLREIAVIYRKSEPVDITFNFAASSILARQIEQGAAADLFISADQAKVESLERKNLLVPGSRTPLFSNALVVVVPADSSLRIHSASDLAKLRRIALAEPSTVPAGVYARKYLEAEGLWDSLRPAVIPTANVRAALAAVQSGNVDAGFVYATDLVNARNARIAWRPPAEKVPQILYEAALPSDGRNQGAAPAFLRFLQGASAQRIFKKYGFLALSEK